MQSQLPFQNPAIDIQVGGIDDIQTNILYSDLRACKNSSNATHPPPDRDTGSQADRLCRGTVFIRDAPTTSAFLFLAFY